MYVESMRKSYTMKLLLVLLLVMSALFIHADTQAAAETKDDLTGHSLENEMRKAVDRGVWRDTGRDVLVLMIK